MIDNDIDKILRDKVGDIQYEYKDEYWKSAKQYIDSQKPARNNRFLLWLIPLALMLGIGSGYYFTDNTSLPQYQQRNRITQATKTNSNYNEALTAIENHTSKTTDPISQDKKYLKEQEHTFNPTNTINSKNEVEENSLESARKKVNRSSMDYEPAKSQSTLLASHTNNNSAITKAVSREFENPFHCSPISFNQLFEDSLTSIHPAFERPILDGNKLSKPQRLGYGLYGEFFFSDAQSTAEVELNEQSFWSIGTFAEYRLNKNFSFQLGVGYQHQNFRIKSTDRIINEFARPEIVDASYWDYNSYSEWQYQFTFNNGVATHIDSIWTQVTDSNYVYQNDTNYINESDTQQVEKSARYRLNWVEVPLKLRYSHTFGNWEAYGSVGIYMNYLASITKFDLTENTSDLPEIEDFNRLTIDGSIQAGIAYYISPHLRINLAPIVRMDVTKRYGFVNQQSIRYGLTSGIIYRF